MNTKRNMAIITLDSLRWDTTYNTTLPNLGKLFNATNTRWHKVYAQGTYTLPVHVALFQDGHLPSNDLDPNEHPYYSRRNHYRFFNIHLGWNRQRNSRFALPDAPNLVRGYEKLGYRTIGIGGVAWFRLDLPTTGIWKNYFQEFYWEKKFHEDNPDSMLEQLDLGIPLIKKTKGPLFYFQNIPATHPPCRGNNTLQGQADALKFVDNHILKLVDALPRPLTLIIFSDHGTCFGEDGLQGHGFYHKNIVEVPMSIVDLD